MNATPKNGRPREYRVPPPAGFANPEAAILMTILDEARARAIDQFEDLSSEFLNFMPGDYPLSIGALAVHMGWAEAKQMERITGLAIPPDIVEAMHDIGYAVNRGEQPPDISLTGPEIAALCARVRDEISHPGVAALQDIDAFVTTNPRPITPRGMLLHLTWHWTYHAGQIGLLRDLSGAPGYIWAFGSL